MRDRLHGSHPALLRAVLASPRAVQEAVALAAARGATRDTELDDRRVAAAEQWVAPGAGDRAALREALLEAADYYDNYATEYQPDHVVGEASLSDLMWRRARAAAAWAYVLAPYSEDMVLDAIYEASFACNDLETFAWELLKLIEQTRPTDSTT